MPQPIQTSLPADPGNAGNEPPGAPSPRPDAGAGEELPTERSKFSRWLASFGLGETPIPLLRPRKPPKQV